MADSNATIPDATNIIITEPCDYVSNIAYYTSMLSLCLHDRNWTMPKSVTKLLIASFNTLAAGSAFYHGSGTGLGDAMDSVPIAHIALTSYQAAVRPLVSSYVIANARFANATTGATLNGTEIITNMSRIYLNDDLYAWNSAIAALVPQYQNDYFITFGCTVILILRLCLPKAFVDKVLPIVAQIMSLQPQDIAFLLQTFDPVLEEALSSHIISTNSKHILLKRGLGTLLKMFYAFIWQEGIFKGPWLTSANANALGGYMIPLINRLGDILTGYPHPDDVRAAVGIYPGDGMCRHLVAHAKWHEQSANALVDLIYLTDDVHSLLLGGNLTETDPVSAALLAPECVAFDEAAGVEFLGSAELACATSKTENPLVCLARLWLGDAQDSMDGCLVQHDCMSATAAGGWSFASLAACLSTVCAMHVTAPLSLTACLATSGGALDQAACLRRHTTLSPVGGLLVDCLQHRDNNQARLDQRDTGMMAVASFASCVASRFSDNGGRNLKPSAWWTAVHRMAACASAPHSQGHSGS